MVDVKQLVRSSGSVGANDIEAQEALSRKDFRYRVRIVRKEAKESSYWLQLINIGEDERLHHDRDKLIQESSELIRIMSAIINRTSAPDT